MTQNQLGTMQHQNRLSANKSSLGLQKLLDYLKALENKLEILGDEAEKIGLISNDQNAFNLVYNSIRITAEAVDHYEREWPSHVANFSAEKLQKTYEEFIQRIGELTKFALVRMLSYIEYSAKEKIKTSSDPAFANINTARKEGKPVNLSWIMSASMNHGLIDYQTQKAWEGIIELRNCIVHNNGFAEFTDTYNVGGFTLNFHQGKNLRFDIGIFATLIEIGMNMYVDWLKKITNAKSAG